SASGPEPIQQRANNCRSGFQGLDGVGPLLRREQIERSVAGGLASGDSQNHAKIVYPVLVPPNLYMGSALALLGCLDLACGLGLCELPIDLRFRLADGGGGLRGEGLRPAPAPINGAPCAIILLGVLLSLGLPLIPNFLPPSQMLSHLIGR